MAIVNKMRIHGDKSEKVTIVEKILRTMTPKFNFVVCSIEESHDIDMLSIDELRSSLLIHEQKINQQEKEELALKASTENHLTSDNRIGGRGSGRGNGRGRAERAEIITIMKINNKVSTKKINAKEEEENEVATTQSHQTSPKLNVIDATDTGCSNHLSGDKSAFYNLDESFRDNVKFGNNSKVVVMGKGQKGENSDLIGFTDSDYAGDLDDRKSTSGYVFMMGSEAISWSSKKQSIVILSSIEAEFVAAKTCAYQAIWLCKVLEEIHL
ncbi:hypothetical protein GH714_010025 [Hevea brasiliensis]|uniref:Retrovirus-related Pol polyprotein from transposon TNT 1-94-like beta-barrel domain-containing protein n=1 Tax=Hevea brasiliensis TaxID=3981 RepID=A0A6A6NCE7_HEVBR|nr:hypothetical protein GH714_010025 [Hevea brasiliensis]